ncbi:MAG: Lrp/AsnC family transcriptional regulator [Chromatiales bacterium]|nr:Lrp/AsnC family transcriptional regulator [Chromatiales bacterium]
MTSEPAIIDAIDRRIIEETQGGLPLVPQPYHVVANTIGIEPNELMRRLKQMLDSGIIRRIGLVPNHYSLGYKANGMTVWDLPDELITELGDKIGRLDYVSHCYQRPRHQPLWNYNLFAMVHGRDRGEVSAKVEMMAKLLGEHDRGHEILYSSKILKKTGLRIGRGR